MDAPSRVRIAVRLLWISLIAATVASLWDIGTSPEHSETRTEDVLWLAGAAISLGAIPVYFISRRSNWARVLMLVLVLLSGVAAIFLWGAGEPFDHWLIGTTIADAIALYLLFTGASSKWFRERKHEAF
jgi:hypothetical protein